MRPSGDGRGRGGGRGGRAVVPRAARHRRLLREARGDRPGLHRRRLVQDRRSRRRATRRGASSSRGASARCSASATSWWRRRRSRAFIMQHPRVLQAFVFGVPDPKLNEAAVAYVIPASRRPRSPRRTSWPIAGAGSPPTRCRATSASWTTCRTHRPHGDKVQKGRLREQFLARLSEPLAYAPGMKETTP